MKKLKFLILFSFFAAGRAHAIDLTPISQLQPTTDPGGDLANWVQSFYLFSLVGGVFLAVGVIVWAGIRYSLAAGNPSTQSDARDQILQAILGLVLLFGAFIVLNTINPTLTTLSPITLSTVTAPTAATTAPWETTTLPSSVQAEIDPGVNVVLQGTVSGAIGVKAFKSDCANATADKGVVVTKTVPGSSNLVYMCQIPK